MNRDEPPPPPSEALRARVAKTTPVRTRVPMLTFLSVAALAVALAAFAFYGRPLRGDLSDQPRLPFVLVGLTWLIAFTASLAAALLPPPRQVLPDAARAGRTAVIAALVILLACAVGTITVPTSIIPEPWWPRAWGCIAFELEVCAMTVVVTAVALWRVRPAGTWRIGAAVGAAGAALGGAVLHLLCPFSTRAHVAVAHAGAVTLCALLGAVLGGLAARRPSGP
jgi:hypothetical protein